MKIEVLGSINSGEYNRGDIIDLPGDQAQALIDGGHAKPTKEKVSKTEPSQVEKPIQNLRLLDQAKKKAGEMKSKITGKGKDKDKAKPKKNGKAKSKGGK